MKGWGEDTGKERQEGTLTSRVPLWATRAQSPWEPLRHSEGYGPEGSQVMGEEAGVIIYLLWVTPQHCSKWVQVLQQLEPAHR